MTYQSPKKIQCYTRCNLDGSITYVKELPTTDATGESTGAFSRVSETYLEGKKVSGFSQFNLGKNS